MFPHLSFDLDQKRKIELDNNVARKKPRREIDDDSKTFNYTTGTYEIFGNDTDEASQRYGKFKKEPLLIQEKSMVRRANTKSYLNAGEDLENIQARKSLALSREIIKTSIIGNNVGSSHRNSDVKENSNVSILESLLRDKYRSKHLRTTKTWQFYPLIRNPVSLAGKSNSAQKLAANYNDVIETTKLSNGERSNDIIKVYQTQSINNVKKLQSSCVVLKCFDCDSQFDDEQNLKSHAVLHHWKSTFRCDSHTPKHLSRECSKCIYKSVLTAIQRSKKPTPKRKGLRTRKKVIEEPKSSITTESNVIRNGSSKSTKRLHDETPVIVDTRTAKKENCSNSILLDLLTGQARKQVGQIHKVTPHEDDITVCSQSKLQKDAVKNNRKASRNGVKPKVPRGNKASSKYIVYECNSPVSDIILSDNEAVEPNNIWRENNILVPHIEVINLIDKDPIKLEIEENIQVINLVDKDPLELEINEYICFDCQSVIFDDLSKFRNHIALHVGSHFCCKDHSVTKRTDCPKCFYETALSNIKDYVESSPTCEFSVDDDSKLTKHLQEKNVSVQKLTDNHKNIVQTGGPLENISYSSSNSFQTERLSNGELSNNDMISVYQTQSINNKSGCVVVLKCFDCDRKFDNEGNLRSHAVLFHWKSTFKCDSHAASHCSQACSKCIYESLLIEIQRSKTPTPKKTCLSTRQKVTKTGIEEPKNSVSIENNVNRSESSDSTKRLHNETPVMVVNQGAKKQNCSNSILLDLLTGRTRKQMGKIQKVTPSENGITVNSQSNLLVDGVENNKASINGVKPKVPRGKVVDCNSSTSDLSLSGTEEAEPHNISMEDNTLVPPTEENVNDTVVTNLMDEKSPELEINKYVCFDCQSIIFHDLNQFKDHIVMHVGSHFCCMYHSITKRTDCPECFYQTTLLNIKDCVKNCPTCEFSTIDECRLTKHLQEENGCENWMTRKRAPTELKCFHCRYLTSHKKYLIYHAANHMHGSFSCYKHAHRKDANCIECIYEYCLSLAKRDTIYCENCGFRSVIIQVFDIHLCKVSTNDNLTSKKYRCWDCNGFSTTTIDALRQHAVIHYKSNFRCDTNDSCVADCSKCIYQVVVKNLENSVFACKTCNFKSLSGKDYNQHELEGCAVSQNIQSFSTEGISIQNVDVNTEKGISTGKLQCLHCEYKCDTKNMLKYHCKQHYYKSFNCDDHIEYMQVDCQKCIFQCLLKSVQVSLFICDKCNLKTFNGFFFDSHVCKSCDTDDLSFNCFDCAVTCKTIQLLKQHAVDHAGSPFNCADHQNFIPSCKKCIYESVLKSLKINRTFTCRNCDFKAFSWQDLMTHEGETSCQAKLIGEGKTEIEPLKTYACLECNFSHDLLDSMKKHIELHEDNFKCDKHKEPDYKYCPKCFCAKMLSHEFKNICFDCDVRPNFPLKSKLQQHVSEQHRHSYFACTRHYNNKDPFCDRCVYQDVVMETSGVNYINLFCWDCEGKLFSHKSTLEKHITESHVKSKFRCSKHLDETQQRCDKCLYQTLVQNILVIANIQKVGTVFQCFDCDYSSKTLQLFRKHVRVDHENSKFECTKHQNLPIPDYENCPACFYCMIMRNQIRGYLKCYDCSHRPTFGYLKGLKKHLVEVHRKKRSFICPKHSSSDSVNCMKCWFTEQLFAHKESQDITFQCFECDFKHEQLKTFKHHVHSLHQKSDFKCVEHFGLTEVDFNDCPKCFYFIITCSKSRKKETRLLADRPTVIRCYECREPKPFWAEGDLKNHLLSKHVTCSFVCSQHTNESINCGKCWFQRFAEGVVAESEEISLKCFDCAFSTRIFTSYKNHVRKHDMSTFKCDQHPVEVPECQKCFYSGFVKSNRKLRCFECELRPVFPDSERLLSHIYENHKKCVFVCRDHTPSSDSCVKCSFQIFVKKAFSFVCLDCDKRTLPSKSELEKHIKQFHLNTQFTCSLHPLSPQVSTCGRCAYEELVRECINSRISEEPAGSFSNSTVLIFICFDCNNYKAGTDYDMKKHIRDKHMDSTFVCTKHSLGEICGNCTECAYERLALLSKVEP